MQKVYLQFCTLWKTENSLVSIYRLLLSLYLALPEICGATQAVLNRIKPMLTCNNCLVNEPLEKSVCGPCSLWSVELLFLFPKEISAAASPLSHPSFPLPSSWVKLTFCWQLLLLSHLTLRVAFLLTREQEKTLCISLGMCSFYDNDVLLIIHGGLIQNINSSTGKRKQKLQTVPQLNVGI